MTTNPTRLRAYIQKFQFEDLFIEELGWDQYRDRLEVVVNGDYVTLNAFAEKRGMIAFTVAAIPDYKTRRKIEQQVAKYHRENIIIYTDAAQTQQVWQWVRRETGKPLANRERQFTNGQSGENIAQVLAVITFSLEEEEDLTIVDVASRVKAAFDLEKVTKRFYDRFKKQHAAFLAFIEGIPDADLQRWYASVMLNRLMFIYFIQRKGFLDNDPDYLRNRLARTDGNFYRDFLIPLFFEGFAKEQHAPAIKRLLGDVPYLNGGLFLRHQIETLYGDVIQIENRAFEELFDFFDQYHWHLDERPLRDDNEINPDVLGYIFEKYINQKQMGAYYTKEDITEYISKNTVIPFLFDEARKAVPIAFEGDHTLWDLMTENPDRYIYPAVRHGAEIPLPDNIAAGIDNVSERGDWNTPTPPEYGLPTEIWRETVARRRRYEDIRGKIERGEVRQINDLITLNLDIQQFAQDAIDFTDSPDVIRAFWRALNRVTVLDPTCGSGAFLFAALNILEPLYEACLERMEAFLAEFGRIGDGHPQKYSDFRQVMERIDQHPNRRYFILKSIIINNLFGVDIMEEAVEIAKLRLFLKLVAQVDDKDRIEPLPDIDFNIRAGNTLVGFATRAEIQANLFAQAVLPQLEVLTSTLNTFRREQLEGNITPDEMMALKARITAKTGEISAVLDEALAPMHGFGADQIEAFRTTHKPFHWFAEFYGVLNDGGFDVIIGNPPYVEYSKIKKHYKILNYSTEKCGNLYAYVIEVCNKILREAGRMGMIVQMSAICTDRMEPLQDLYRHNSKQVWASSFDDRPAKLFDGLEHIRAAIIINEKGNKDQEHGVLTTNLNRWYSDTRQVLFATLAYKGVDQYIVPGSFPK
ncbi:MAG: SAM-dependent methyltransferase, partial [Anaerolineaceae bacterium]